MTKKIRLSVLFGILFFCSLYCFGTGPQSKFKSAITEIPVGNNTLLIRFYVFNDLSEGRQIAEEVYGIRNFDEILNSDSFRRLQRIVPGEIIQGYDYGMFKTDSEYWILKNQGDGYLYGIGRYINRK